MIFSGFYNDFMGYEGKYIYMLTKGKSPMNGGLDVKINYKCWISHCHVWVPTGN